MSGDVGDLLAIQFDGMRESARHRSDAAEYRRRVEIAQAFVADMPCTCATPDDDCPKHYLERVLAGDE